MNKEIKVLVDKITKIRFAMIELEIRINTLTDQELAQLEKLERQFDRVALALHATKDRMGA